MEIETEEVGPVESTIYGAAHQCLESFQKCSVSASIINAREISRVEDQLARFSTWTASIGVFSEGRASMDHRLRNTPEVQSVVIELLESLDYRVQTWSGAMEANNEPFGAEAKCNQNDLLHDLSLETASEISQLNRISNAIRKASKDIHAVKASSFRIEDEDGNNVELCLLGNFEHYIRDRFPELDTNIQDRLARAMLLRRKRILYRRSRQGKKSTAPPKPKPKTIVTLPLTSSVVSSPQKDSTQEKQGIQYTKVPKIAPSQNHSATTLVREKFQSSTSAVSVSKTVALENHETLIFPPAPGQAYRRKFEKIKQQTIDKYWITIGVEKMGPKHVAELNQLIKSELLAMGEISCPFCLDATPAQNLFNDKKWKNHLLGDLDPYVCLFKNCDQPDLIYSHNTEWLRHLHTHIKVWNCSYNHQQIRFGTQEDYISHMQTFHNTGLSNSQLRILSNNNSGKLKSIFEACPLCGKVDGNLEDHITGHLRSLAIKSLPPYEEEMPIDEESEAESFGSSQPGSRSTIRQAEEDTDMLECADEHFWDNWVPPPARMNDETFTEHSHRELVHFDEDARPNYNFREPDWNLEEDEILKKWHQKTMEKKNATYGREDGIKSSTLDGEISNSEKPEYGKVDATPATPNFQDHVQDERPEVLALKAARERGDDAFQSTGDISQTTVFASNTVDGIDIPEKMTLYPSDHSNYQGNSKEQSHNNFETKAGPVPDEVVASSDLAIGISSESEQLDPRYRVEPAYRFQPGEIFKVLWSEPQGLTRPGKESLQLDRPEYRDEFGGRIFVGFRRFLVIANDQDHCNCVPILTYGGQGCRRRGVVPGQHGIIHVRGHKARLLPNEPHVGFQPVRAEIYQTGEKLGRESRVNYSKLMTVEHNLKVFFVGRVVAADWDTVSDAVNKCWEYKTHQPRNNKR